MMVVVLDGMRGGAAVLVVLLGGATGCTGALESEGVDITLMDGGPLETGEDAGTAGDAGRGRDAGSVGADAGPTSPPPPGLPDHCTAEPLGLPIDGCRPAPLASTGDPYEDCVRRINQLRAECQCLGPLERWRDGEDCADMQAEYDANGAGAHGGFRAGICSPRGRAQNECPAYPAGSIVPTCLQQMWDEGPGEPFREHGHYLNMTNPAHSRVACGFYTTEDGRVWAVQNFN